MTRYIACIALIVFLFPVLARAQSNSQIRKEFSLRLEKSARDRAPDRGSRYYAILRGGLLEYGRLLAASGSAKAAASLDIAALSDMADASDDDETSRFIVLQRLGSEGLGTRVVNGNEVPEGKFRNVVALTSNKYMCTGVIINENSVLTAAHCACDLRLWTNDPGIDDLKRVYISNNIANSKKSKEFQVDLTPGMTVFLSPLGPNFCKEGVLNSVLSGSPDLAVVRVVGKFPEPPIRIASADLVERSVGKLDSGFIVVGFGCTNPDQDGTRYIRCPITAHGIKAMADIYHSQHCLEPFCALGGREFVLIDKETNDPSKAKDTCGGDSGGPVIIYDESPMPGSTRVRLAGITSRSFEPAGACGFGGIYAKLMTEQIRTWLTGANIEFRQ